MKLITSLLLGLLLSSSAFAASDLACSLSQSPKDASANIAALLSRGYLAAGYKYTSDGGGVDSNNQMVYSEHMLLGKSLLLTHQQQNRVDSYTLTTVGDMTDKQIFDALLDVSEKASATLSKEDAEALQNCNHLLGQYIGVSPQPDHP